MKKITLLITVLILGLLLVGCSDLTGRSQNVIKEELQAITLKEDLVYELGYSIDNPEFTTELIMTTDSKNTLVNYSHELANTTMNLNYYEYNNNSYLDYEIKLGPIPIRSKFKLSNTNLFNDNEVLPNLNEFTPDNLDIASILTEDEVIKFLLESDLVSMSKKKKVITVNIEASKQDVIDDKKNLVPIAIEVFDIESEAEFLELINMFDSLDFNLEIEINDTKVTKILVELKGSMTTDGVTTKVELNIKNIQEMVIFGLFEGYKDIPEEFEFNPFS